MMKTILFTIAILIGVSTFGQTPTSVIRLAGPATAFGQNIPRGTILIDMTSRKRYLALLPLAGTKFIGNCNKLLLDNKHTSDGGSAETAEIKEIGTNSATHYIGELISSDGVGTEGIVIAVWSQDGKEKALLVALTNSGPGIFEPVPSGQSDKEWRLPTVWEINACFNSVVIINSILGDVNGFTTGSYWSSTESTGTQAFSKSFTSGATDKTSAKGSFFKKHKVRTHY